MHREKKVYINLYTHVWHVCIPIYLLISIANSSPRETKKPLDIPLSIDTDALRAIRARAYSSSSSIYPAIATAEDTTERPEAAAADRGAAVLVVSETMVLAGAADEEDLLVDTGGRPALFRRVRRGVAGCRRWLGAAARTGAGAFFALAWGVLWGWLGSGE